MKVLLDENVPHDLRPFLPHHETCTAAYIGYAGLKIGKLPDAAEAVGFEVLVTGDKTLQYEQNMAGRTIALARTFRRRPSAPRSRSQLPGSGMTA